MEKCGKKVMDILWQWHALGGKPQKCILFTNARYKRGEKARFAQLSGTQNNNARESLLRDIAAIVY